MKSLFFLLKRNLIPRSEFFSLKGMATVALLGIVLGVAAQSVTLSILDGFEKSFKQSILGFNAQLVLLKEGDIENSEDLQKQLLDYTDKGIRAMTPFLYRETLIVYHSTIKGVVLKGIDPQSFSNVYQVQITPFSPNSKPGAQILSETAEYPPVILGRDLAEQLALKPEDPFISVFSPEGNLSKVADEKNFKRFQVVGVFSTGLYEYDSQFMLVNLSTAQSFFKIPDKITGFEMKVEPLEAASSLATQLQNVFETPYQIISWNQLNAEIFQALRIEKQVFFILMGLLVLVASSNLVGLMIVLIAAQRKEVSILRALGMKSRNLKALFALQGAFLAGMGVIIGLILGAGLTYGLAHFQIFDVAKEVYLVSKLPVAFSMKNFLQVFVFAMLISVIASLWAARRVTKIELDL